MADPLQRLSGLDAGAIFTEADARELDAVFVVIRALQELLARAHAGAATRITVKELARIMEGLR